MLFDVWRQNNAIISRLSLAGVAYNYYGVNFTQVKLIRGRLPSVKLRNTQKGETKDKITKCFFKTSFSYLSTNLKKKWKDNIQIIEEIRHQQFMETFNKLGFYTKEEVNFFWFLINMSS